MLGSYVFIQPSSALSDSLCEILFVLEIRLNFVTSGLGELVTSFHANLLMVLVKKNIIIIIKGEKNK